MKAWSAARIVMAVVCLFAAGFFYLAAESSIGGLGASDPAGNGLAAGLAFFAELLLWLALAGFVALACRGARAPSAVLIVNVALVVIGAIASIASLSTMQTPTWVRITPTVMPPLAVLCAAWTASSGELSDRVRRGVAYGFAALALPLAIAPFYEMQRLEADRPRREAEAQQAREAYERGERQKAASEAQQLRALGSDAPLERYMAFFWTSQGDQARDAVRRLPSRQVDTIRLLDGGIELYRLELSDWELEDTPQLCAAYRRRLNRILANPQTAPVELDHQIDNFRWLLAGGCDLRAELNSLIPMIRARPPSMAPGDYSGEIENLLRFAPAATPAAE